MALDKTLEPWVAWETCEEEQAAEVLARLVDDAPQSFGGSTFVSARSSKLAFYAEHRLIELLLLRTHGPERVFALHGPEDTFWLDGSSGPLYEANEAESLALTDVTVHDYIRFYFYFVRGEDGAFVLIESPDEIALGEAGSGLDRGRWRRVQRRGRTGTARDRS